ncbi:hypothetical protein Y032_0051g2088 [Ancylostoma ceylanicum]|uniref:Uncharacterized protein n=1 Tax=Ancylostoma ceylanicum TaxID=53326 RepID=A0A016U9D9_9BILA|nr:hypothetical protein Y032_0051g2088 [Ancylostoma ceylanicum]
MSAALKLLLSCQQPANQHMMATASAANRWHPPAPAAAAALRPATSCCYTQVMLPTTPPTDRPIVNEDYADGVNMSECEQHAPPSASVTCAPHHARGKIRPLCYTSPE